MSKSPRKGPAERRKRPRSKKRTPAAGGATQSAPQSTLHAEEACFQCSKDLARADRSLFVEEEVGRTFCSEECIGEFFSPEVERLEKEYFRRLTSRDLKGEEKEKYAHLRWITLQEPDEVWQEKTLGGDIRYTMISEFHPDQKPIWCVCICLALRGEPSFLYLAFPTQDSHMVEQYRRGERIPWERKPFHSEEAEDTAPNLKEEKPSQALDGLADAWTEEETIRAQIIGEGRKENDIPAEEFHLYESCVQETLEEPDEIWSIETRRKAEVRLYHFIRSYPNEESPFWMLIVARDSETDEDQIEILDLFPTRDLEMVERYRQGELEHGAYPSYASSRVVH